MQTLPTRDALLPFIVLLAYVVKEKITLSKLVANLPQRFSSSDRIQDFSRENSLKLLQKGESDTESLLEAFGLKNLKVVDINQIDGLRLTFDTENIIHLRPSGNAPELRCCVETYSQDDSDNLVNQVLICIRKIKL